MGTEQEEVWAGSPCKGEFPGSLSAALGSAVELHEGASQHYACASARTRAQTLKLQKTEFKPVKKIQSGCRAVIRVAAAAFFHVKRMCFLPSPHSPGHC